MTADHPTEVPERGGEAAVHWIEWYIESEAIYGVVRCRASVGAECRLSCPEGCESWAAGHEHELTDAGECMVCVWFDNADEGMEGLFRGDRVPLRDGWVTPLWGGDWYEWEYANV